jgi:uncharacterized integral membrane protein
MPDDAGWKPDKASNRKGQYWLIAGVTVLILILGIFFWSIAMPHEAKYFEWAAITPGIPVMFGCLITSSLYRDQKALLGMLWAAIVIISLVTWIAILNGYLQEAVLHKFPF